MTARSSIFAALLAALFIGTAARAAGSGDDEVVATIGTVKLTKGDLEARLAKIPRAQLSQLGTFEPKIVDRFTREIVVPEIVFGESAKAKLGDRPDLRQHTREVYRAALMSQLQKEAIESVTPAEMTAYYAANRERFATPERLSLWRILVPSKEAAQRIIDDAKQPGGDKRWPDTARAQSVDKATSERSGSLGMVGPDGVSNEPNVKVDPALFVAAKKVKDGEVVPDPVPEGPGFAVVWRRGSTPPVTRTLEQESQTIRQMMVRQRVETNTKDLLAKLHKELVRDENPTLTGMIELSQQGELVPRKRPGITDPRAPGKPQPSAVPGGLR